MEKSRELPSNMETKAKGPILFVVQLTFPEFDFETEVKVDFPSACI